MSKIGVALDLGTSGFRGQAIDLDRPGIIISTAITNRHPMPGANVIDHLHFAIKVGLNFAHEMVIHAVNQVIHSLGIDRSQVIRMAICGNPIQLSLFQEIEIRDLAYAGMGKLRSLGVDPLERNAEIVKAREIYGLDLPGNVDVLIPPAVHHEIGADALAMIVQTSMLENDEICLATDYGTNAEMALIVDGTVYTGSAAAGPALEGQQIEEGLLALPGAISDVEIESGEIKLTGMNGSVPAEHTVVKKLKTYVLNQKMKAVLGDTVDLTNGKLLNKGEIDAIGITGTGVIALVEQGLKNGIIRLPGIHTFDKNIHLANGIKFGEKDLLESGKAIGAIRAGHFTLCELAGIKMEDVKIAYMAGAAGTYMDALKSQKIGMVPSGVQKIFQSGNTSLAMARNLIWDVDELWRMQRFCNDLKQHHCMFADSKVFKNVYLLELAYWTEGMSWKQYQEFLRKFGLPILKKASYTPQIINIVNEEQMKLGAKSNATIKITDIEQRRTVNFESCTRCMMCVDACPENALQFDEARGDISISLALCNGIACQRCEQACPEGVFNFIKLITSKSNSDCVNCLSGK